MVIKDGELLSVSNEDVFDGFVAIPLTVDKINKEAFLPVKNNVKVLSISNNIETIEPETFKNMINLKSIHLPTDLKEIGTSAFYGCTKLDTIILPQSVTSIGKSAFSNCINLTNVIFSNNLKKINAETFSNCSRLKNAIIPNSVTEIGKSAFSGCNNLKILVLPSKLEKIGENAFSECSSLKNVKIPESTTIIDGYAFARTGITSIKIPNEINVIAPCTFYQCLNLEDVELPEKLKTIKLTSFSGCINLKEIKLPSSLLYLGSGAFSSCNKLTRIVIPNNVKTICDSAFKNCANLESIMLPKNIEEISESLFANCTNLKSISIPSSVKTISSLAFSKCTNLVSIQLNKELETISSSAFSDCKNLKEIILPISLKNIKTHAFSKCENLEKIKIPNSVTFIDDSAFLDCKSLKEVTLSNNLESIEPSTFKNCTSLQSISIPESVATIKSNAFINCTSLKSIKLPSALKKINSQTFENCSALEDISLPEDVTVIDFSAFFGCKSLKNITIPKNIKYIEDSVFDSCPTLGTVKFPNSLKKIGKIGTDSFLFFEKLNDGFRLSSNQLPNSIPLSTMPNINPAFISRHWDYKNDLLKEQINPLVGNFYNTFVSYLPYNQANNFLEYHNFTFFKQLKKYDKGIKNNSGLYKLLYNLGGFLPPLEDNGKTIDYAQKVIDFFIEKIDKKEFDLSKYYRSFKSMKTNGLKTEFTEFFLSNFDEIMKEQEKDPQFIEKCYNNFEEVQKTITSNKGSQRQLKLTVSKFVEYFKENKFSGITPENKNIAIELGQYTPNQESFDDAAKIDEEHKANNVPDNIVGYHLKKNTAFKQIIELAKQINNSQIKTINNLTNTATNEFSFDWIEKNDPQNFILGKLCSCCAHIEGVGYGIMKAGIVNPNVQTLVIRDGNSEIIAKATLYINEKQGYGVFNNLEVQEKLPSSSHKKIYQKFILGVQVFALEYNKTHLKNPLKQINVGMEINDVDDQIEINHKKSQKPFVALDYGKYSKDEDGYSGDNSLKQYIVWQSQAKKNES